jgi:peptidoglycan/xylan/chitin deacetylase (PgdA/CDA1 family)
MRGLRVLLYHNVSADGRRDDLTVSSSQLEEQFQYLQQAGYTSIGFSDLIAYCDQSKPLPPKPVLVTFDDGFRNNATIAYPLAKKYGIKINLFVVPLFIRAGGYRSNPCLQPDDLEELDPSLVEVGLHSYAHANYAKLHPAEIANDIERCLYTMDEMGISYQPCLAYPFGAFPKRQREAQDKLFEILQEKGIRLAFRIGNSRNFIQSCFFSTSITGLKDGYFVAASP